jgi:TolB-like protein/predicted Ser/Thr protein kinase
VIIGRYVDLQLLGQGGMGAVYRGRDPELDRPVAIKLMLQTTPDFVARFRREAQSIARLAHATIVQVYDFVMELIDGTPLDEIIRTRGALPPLEAVRLAKQAAAGLGAAHRAGIVHRDVKPSNLIVDGRGHLKLVDFGIARIADGSSQLTNAAALMGTPGYMAPEQASGKKVDHRADVYALGMTMFELLAGRPAFTADDPIALVVMNLQQPLPDLRQHAPGTPEELVQLVEMMAAKDPDARLQSCDAVAAALEDIESRLRATGNGAAFKPTEPAAVAVPPTHVHGDRPPSLQAALDAGLHPYQIPQAAPPARGKTPLVIGAAVAVVVLGAGVAARELRKPPAPPLTVKIEPPPRPPEPRPPEPRPGDTSIEPHAQLPTLPPKKLDGPLRVAVLRFKNVGNDKALAMLELGIGETAVNAMADAGKGVQLVERTDIESDVGEIDRGKDDHFDKATVAEKGKLEGIQMAVQGGFQRAGKLVRITARFVRVENGEILDTLTITRPAKDVFGAQDDVARGLKDKLVALAALEKTR